MNEAFGLVRSLINSQEVEIVKFSFLKPQVVAVVLNALAILQGFYISSFRYSETGKRRYPKLVHDSDVELKNFYKWIPLMFIAQSVISTGRFSFGKN